MRLMTRQKTNEIDVNRGQRIRALREGLGESQATFGAHFNVEQATVSRWEEGRSVARSLWPRMAKLAGTTVVGFFFAGEMLEIPLLSWVAASAMRDVGDIPLPSGAETFPVGDLPPGKWFALKVQGDSMNRVAPEGAIIFVNADDRVLKPKHFYVVEAPEGSTFKRYFDGPPRFEPHSTSEGHPTYFPKHQARVTGRVGRVVLDLP